ncbi:MAG: hypothetical protein O7D91_10865 [Planctomycetota bacterium]|nr:hypothetical protein [Planctomycetota bacterium]
MVAARDVLASLSNMGITIEAHGDGLRYRPKSAMTPDLLVSARRCKGELLSLLAKPASRADAEFDRFARVAKPMPGGGWYCPVHGSPEMPAGVPGAAWDAFVADCGRLGGGSKA